MKLLKRTLLVLLLLPIIAALLLWGVTHTVKPETLRGWINTSLSGMARQPARIEGNVSWQLFPTPGVRAEKILVGETRNGQKPDVSIDTLVLKPDLGSLLRAKPVFGAILVEGFEVHVRKHAPTPAPKTEQGKQGAPSSLAASLAIQKLLASRGTVVFHNPDGDIRLTGLQFSADSLNMHGQEFPLELKAKIKMPSITAPVRFNGQIRLGTDWLQNPAKALSGLKLTGQLSVRKLIAGKLLIDSLDSTLQLGNGTLTLKPLSLNLYNGTAVGAIAWNLNNQTITLDQTANNLDAGKLISDMAGQQTFTGTLDASLHSTARLNGPNLLQTMDGRGNVSIKDGQLRAIDLDTLIRKTSNELDAIAKAPQQNLNVQNDTPENATTRFKLMGLQYQVRSGILTFDPLVIQTDTLELKGNGTLNLETQTIAAKLKAVSQTPGVTLAALQQRLGGSIPMSLSGTLNHPLLTPDMEVLTPLLATAAITKLTDKLGNKPVKDIGKQLNGLLKALP